MTVREEVEKALDVAAQVAENPLAQTALGLMAVPPKLSQAFGQLLETLDEHLQGTTPVTPVTPAPDPTPSPAPQQASTADNAAPLGDAAPAASTDPKAPSTSTGTGSPGSEIASSSTPAPVFVPPQVGPPVA